MPEEIHPYGGGGGGGGAAKVSISGANTDGTLTLISTGTMYMAGGNNITISQDGNSLTFVGMDNVGATTFRGGVSTGGNTLGTTGTVNNQIIFVGGNNVTLSQSAGANSATVTISGPAMFKGGVSNVGNSLGTTGTVSNQILFVGGNNITLSQSSAAGGATITVSGPTTAAQSAQTGISSISVSDTVYTSGQVEFIGSNNVTVKSGAGQKVIIDMTGGGGSFSGGVSSDGNTAGTTGTVSGGILFVGGSNVTLSQHALLGDATITINAVQSTGFVNSISVGGNTSGDTSAGTGKLALMGGNNITLSGSTAAGGITLTISGPNAGGAQTGISSIAADGTTYTSGMVVFSGSNAASVNSSAAGQTLIIDVPVQSVQTQNSVLINGSSGQFSFNAGNLMSLSQNASSLTYINLMSSATHIQEVSSATAAGAMVSRFANEDHVHAGVGPAGISSGGNTLGDTGAKFGRLVFAGGNNITLSGSSSNNNAQTITIIGASGGGAGYTAGLSTGGNTSGDATNVTGRLIFAGGNNITLSGSTNAGSMTITISAPSGGGAGVSSGGNTAGTTGTVDYQLVFVGGSNISLSQSINGSSGTITINGASGGGAGAAVTVGGNSTSAGAGYILISSGTMTIAGGNNITLSQNGNAVTISGANAGGAQTGISSIQASDATYTSGKVIFTGSNNITVVSGTGQNVIISGPTGGGAGMGSAGNSAGTSGTVGKELYFVGGSNISLSQSVNGASATLTINAATAGGGQTAISGISMSDAMYTSGTVNFVGSGQVSVYSGTGQRVIISGAGGGGQTGISSIVASDATYTSGQVVFVGSNNVTIASGANQSVIVSGPNPFAAAFPDSGNTAGTTFVATAGLALIGSNNITLSGSTNGGSGTIIISGPTGGGAGMGTGGNTSGTSGTVGKELYFYGGSNISLSQSVNGSSASLSIIGASGGGAGFSAGISGGNTSGDTGSVTGRVLFAGGNNITLSGSTNAGSMTITISAGAGGALSLDQIDDPANDVLFLMNTRQIQFQWGSNLTAFATAGSRAGLFEIDVIGGTGLSTLAASDHLEVLHIHQSSNDFYNHLVHLEAAGTRPIPLHIVAAGSIAAEFEKPLKVSSDATVPLILGTSQSNSVANLNANYLQGKVSSDFLTAQSVQTQGSVQVNGSTGAITFNAGNNMSLSTNGSSLTYINVLSSSAIAQPVSNVSSAGTQSSNFALADHAHVGVAGLNVSGTASTWVGNVMLSVTNLTLVTAGNSSAGSIGISAAAPGAGGAALGMTNTGNTSGTVFTTATGTVYFQGTNNITVSNSSAAGSLQTLWISGPSGGGAGMGTGTNTSGTSGTVGKELFIYGGAGVGLSQSVNGSSASLSIMPQTLYSYEPFPLEAGAHTGITNVLALGNGTSGPVYMFPMTILNHVRAEYMNLIFQQSFTTNGNSSGRQSGNFQYGLYTRRTGASSTELSLATSSSVSWAVTGNNSSYSINQPTVTATNGFTYAETNSAGSNISSGYTGAKLLVLPLSYMMTPGVYWMGIMQTVSTNSINVGITNSLFGLNQGTTLQNLAPMGSFTSAYTAGSNMMGGSGGAWMFGKGSWSTAGNVGLPNSMGLQSVTVGGVSNLPFVRFWAKS